MRNRGDIMLYRVKTTAIDFEQKKPMTVGEEATYTSGNHPWNGKRPNLVLKEIRIQPTANKRSEGFSVRSERLTESFKIVKRFVDPVSVMIIEIPIEKKKEPIIIN